MIALEQLLVMSGTATSYQQNVHQIGQTVAWSLLLNAAIIAGALRYDRIAALAHAVFGLVIVIMTYIFVLMFLVPYGFNAQLFGDWRMFAHAILGCALLGLALLQAVGGLLCRFLQQGKAIDIFNLKLIRRIHRFVGYFIAIIYKIMILWSWLYDPPTMYGLIAWQIFCLLVFLAIKFYRSSLQKVVTDVQAGFLCPEVKSLRQVSQVSDNFILFGNYIYDARYLSELHPGGYRVIELVKGREVDRFLYGMYSAELYPQLPAFSHSARAMQLVGNPIAKLVTPPTFDGFASDIQDAEIRLKSCISQKTQIYAIGLMPRHGSFRYLGYRDLGQLGQYYSLTVDSLTRLYTAVNFLDPQNIQHMSEVFKISTGNNILQPLPSHRPSETQMPSFLNKKNNLIKENLIEQPKNGKSGYLPLMLKVYQDGKLTSTLSQNNFLNMPVKLSSPRGKGLQLSSTPSGRIIVVAGGTGLFPFSDLIDLLFKTQLIEENHPLSPQLLAGDPLLAEKPFTNFHFTFLIAINNPEDIHPITFEQLARLSEKSKVAKVVLRVSTNPQRLQKVGRGIEFTREFFNKRVVSEASNKGFSRVWICGPPVLNTGISKIMLDTGYRSDQFLLI